MERITFGDKLSFLQQVDGFGMMIEPIYKSKVAEITNELVPYYDHIDLINNSEYSDEIKNLAHIFFKYSITPRQEMLIKSLDHMRKVRNMTKMLGNPNKQAEMTPLPIEEARNIPFEEIYGFQKVRQNRTGFKALCPFHQESRPSFSVKNNLYKCFGCGKGGDTINFVMELYGFCFSEAVRWITKVHKKSERSAT